MKTKIIWSTQDRESLYQRLEGLFKNGYVFTQKFLSAEIVQDVKFFRTVACDEEHPGCPFYSCPDWVKSAGWSTLCDYIIDHTSHDGRVVSIRKNPVQNYGHCRLDTNNV